MRAGEPFEGFGRQTLVVLRRCCIGLVALALVGGACSDGGDVVDGPAQESIDNEPPYGPGVAVGETYEYVLYVHCGVRWARIDGTWWETASLDDGNANPPRGWGNPFDAGRLRMLDDSTAEYTGGPDVTVRFVRTDVTQMPFECL